MRNPFLLTFLLILILPIGEPVNAQEYPEGILEEWQKASIPTGLEQPFLMRIEREIRNTARANRWNVSLTALGNLMIRALPESSTPEITVACEIDEPTFVVSGYRSGEYFGVRPLFFEQVNAEFLKTWVGRPLRVLNERGEEYPTVLAIPSTHLWRGRHDEFWSNLKESDLYLDVGQQKVEILNRVVKNRTLEKFPNHYYVGDDLGARMACLALWEWTQDLIQTFSPSNIHLVFLVQGRFGHRGLQEYLTQNRPKVLVLLRAGSDILTVSWRRFGSEPITDMQKKTLKGLGVTEATPYERDVGRFFKEFGLLSSMPAPVYEYFNTHPVLWYQLPIHSFPNGKEAVRVNTMESGWLTYVARIKRWLVK